MACQIADDAEDDLVDDRVRKGRKTAQRSLVSVCHTTMTYSKDVETSSDGDNTARR